jgi:hypothetical protein
MGSISPQQQRERFIAQYIVQPPVALYDIGVGPKTEWEELPKLWPNMKVYGCEPHPAIYRELIRRHFPGPWDRDGNRRRFRYGARRQWARAYFSVCFRSAP